MKRITLVTGHFGSGKTEFSMNLAADLRKAAEGRVAVIDLDIANPYFRSRESQAQLEGMGIDIFYNHYGYDITEDMPAIGAVIRTPLENDEYTVVADVGGNDTGAMVLNQFGKYFTDEDSEMLCVLNANRPDTESPELMVESIESLEAITGLKAKGIINNTHMLRETEASDMIKGYRMCSEVSEKKGIPVVWNTCRRDLLENLEGALSEEGIAYDVYEFGDERPKDSGTFVIYPIDLYMRPEWLDKAVF